MIKRMAKSRAWRKFFRNKMALVATSLIGVYALIFVAIVGVQITDATGLTDVGSREGLKLRVMPPKWPGFLEAPDVDRRYDSLDWQIGNLDRLFKKDLNALDDPAGELGSVSLAERKLAELPIDELRALLDETNDRFDTLNEVFGVLEEVEDEIYFLPDSLAEAQEAGDSELVAELEAQLVSFKAERDEINTRVDEGLASVEASLEDLMPMPTGLDGLVYSFRTMFGSDVLGQSISVRAFYSIKIAFQVGLVVATLSVLIGTLLGAMAGFYGGWLDGAVMWLISTLSSIPYLVLLAVLAVMFSGHQYFDNSAEYPELQLVKLYTAMGLTFWVGTARVIRGEVMKIKELEYVQAATAIGFGRFYIVLKHVIPNTFHIMFINFSLLFIGAIKSEVILSFLGLGVSGQPSWGTMISNSKDDLSNYFFWEVGAASFLMFVLVLAFNIVSDALQDAFDPKHV